MTATNHDTASARINGKRDVASPVPGSLYRFASAVWSTVMGGFHHVEANIVPVCICGAIMFPVYWLVWKFLFPQPYENLTLRLIGSAWCLLIAANSWWPASTRRHLPVVWLAMLLYALPFFFTFMLLQNNTSDIWIMSTLSALFLLVLLVDWISLIVLFVVGSLIGWLVHQAVSPELTAMNLYVEFVPIFLFAVISGTVFNYKAAGFRQAAERARTEVAKLLAKELQSPLVSIRTHGASLAKLIPIMVQTYLNRGTQQPRDAALEEPQLRALERVPGRIDEAVEQINGIIDTLLVQGGEQDLEGGPTRTLSIAHCLDEAIARLPLRPDLERSRIVFLRDNEFRVHGSPALISRVLAGILETSLGGIQNRGSARLIIELGGTGRWNYVRLKDSASELRAKTQARMLRFGLARTDKDLGSRPELAFAKLVLERMGGSMTRTIEFGRTADVVLWFPKLGAA